MVVNALAMYTYHGNTSDPFGNHIDAKASQAAINAMTDALGNDTNRTYRDASTPHLKHGLVVCETAIIVFPHRTLRVLPSSPT